MAHPPLTLQEEILMLVLTDRDGSLLQATNYRFPLAGAILAELLLRGRMELEEGASQALVTPIGRERTGDPVLDDALRELHTATRRAPLERWVGRFAEHEEMCFRVARQLCRKKVLREHEGRVRLVFRRTVYADLEPAAREELMGRVRHALFGEGPVDVRTSLLVALAETGDVIGAVFDPAEVLEHRERLRRVAAGEETEDEPDAPARKARNRVVSATAAAVLAAREAA